MPKQYEANCFVSTRNSSVMQCTQTFGDKACHPERSEGSRSPDAELLRCAQDDRQDSMHVRSREVFSPNVEYALPACNGSLPFVRIPNTRLLLSLFFYLCQHCS